MELLYIQKFCLEQQLSVSLQRLSYHTILGILKEGIPFDTAGDLSLDIVYMKFSPFSVAVVL
jgi:hypothetical protein